MFEFSQLVSIHCPTIYGQNVFVTGAALALGGGDVEKACALRWTDGHYWIGSFDVSFLYYVGKFVLFLYAYFFVCGIV